ncbi:MAG: MarR family transcriptional regulator [Spongiibacteraceae bacterium]|nr:MarR family transcriptional regulator [Spongiibacteraceae bacterium]
MLGRANHLLRRRLRDRLSRHRVTITQYTALSILSASRQLSNAQLAERALVSPQAANETIRTMELRGWIEREPEPSHGRIIQLRVTPRGEKLLAACHQSVAELEEQMLGDMDEAARTVLLGQLQNLVRRLGTMELVPD